MLRYELCIWPNKNRVIIRYNDGSGKEVELTEKAIRDRLSLGDVKVSNAEIDAEIEQQRKINAGLPKQLSFLRTNAARRIAQKTLLERRKEEVRRNVAHRRMKKAAKKIQSRFESLIRSLTDV